MSCRRMNIGALEEPDRKKVDLESLAWPSDEIVRHVLFVHDDDHWNKNVFTTILHSVSPSCVLHTADTNEEALAITLKQTIDIVFIESVMCIWLIDKIHTTLATRPFIVYASNPLAKPSPFVDASISKPYMSEEIKRVFESESLKIRNTL